jgi:uncharacterized protein
MRAEAPPAGYSPRDYVPPPLADRAEPLAALALDAVGSCNIACRYCAESATQPRRRPMSEETLAAAWRLLFPDGRPRPGCSLHLGSGEPLLGLPLLRKLAALIERHGGSAAEGRPEVHLTTNGTLATPAVRDWLVASGWRVKISLDGPREIHDRWRIGRRGEGTWERVAAAVADLAARMPERFSVTAVLCRGADPVEVFAGIAGLGARRIELVPVAHDDPQVLPGRADVARYERFVAAYARRFAAGEELPVLIRFAGKVRRAMGFELQRVPCAAGRGFAGVAPDGALYPCFRFVGVDGFRLGSLAEGPDSEAAAAFRHGAGRPWEEREPCRDCWAAALCGGPCFAVAEMFGPGGSRPFALHCDYVRADARAAVRLVRRLSRRDPERLLAFVPELRRALDRLEV